MRTRKEKARAQGRRGRPSNRLMRGPIHITKLFSRPPLFSFPCHTHIHTHTRLQPTKQTKTQLFARANSKKIDGYTKLIEKPFDKHFLLQNGLQLSATILGVLIVVHNLFQKKKKNKKDIATTIHIGPLK